MFRRKKQNGDVKVSSVSNGAGHNSSSGLFHRKTSSRATPEGGIERSSSAEGEVDVVQEKPTKKKTRDRSSEKARLDFWFNQNNKSSSKMSNKRLKSMKDEAINSHSKRDSFFKKLDELEEKSLHSSSRRKERILSDADASRMDLFQLIVRREWKRALVKLKQNPADAKRSKKMSLRGLGVTTALPIHLAVTKRPPSDFVEELVLAHPAGPKQPDKQWKRLPIHLACMCDAGAHVLQMLLESHPLALNVVDEKEGRAPLHYICRYGSPYEISLLMNARKEALRVKDKHGKTPVDLARENPNQHRDTIVRRLENTLRAMGTSSSHHTRRVRSSVTESAPVAPVVAATAVAAASVASPTTSRNKSAMSSSSQHRRAPRPRSVDSLATPDYEMPPPPGVSATERLSASYGGGFGSSANNNAAAAYGNSYLDFNQSLTLEEVQALSLMEYQESKKKEQQQRQRSNTWESSSTTEKDTGGLSDREEHHRSIFDDEILQSSLRSSSKSSSLHYSRSSSKSSLGDAGFQDSANGGNNTANDEMIAKKLHESLNNIPVEQEPSISAKGDAPTSSRSGATEPSSSLHKSLNHLDLMESSNTIDESADVFEPQSLHKSLNSLDNVAAKRKTYTPSDATVSSADSENAVVLSVASSTKSGGAIFASLALSDAPSSAASSSSGNEVAREQRSKSPMSEDSSSSASHDTSLEEVQAVQQNAKASPASDASKSVRVTPEKYSDDMDIEKNDHEPGQPPQAAPSSGKSSPLRVSSSSRSKQHQLNLEDSDDEMQPRSRRAAPRTSFKKPPPKSAKQQKHAPQAVAAVSSQEKDQNLESSNHSRNGAMNNNSQRSFRSSYEYDSPSHLNMSWKEVAVGSADVPTFSSSSHGRSLTRLFIDVPRPDGEESSNDKDDSRGDRALENSMSLLGSLRDMGSETSSQNDPFENSSHHRDPKVDLLRKEMEEQERALDEKVSEISQLETHMKNLDLRQQALTQECEYVKQSAQDKQSKAKEARAAVLKLEKQLEELKAQMEVEQKALELAESGAKVQKETLNEHMERINATHTEKEVLITIRENLLHERNIMTRKLETTRNELKSMRDVHIVNLSQSALGEMEVHE